MSRRNKLEKFAELLTFKNVYQNYYHKDPTLRHLHGTIVERKGKWSTDHFGNANPIVLELACGWGEYSIGMARQSPTTNFIGVDIKGNRIWKGAKLALEEGLQNVAFLRTRIEQIDMFFDPAEIAEIWITFPDPFLKDSKSNRRLTALPFLHRYRNILKPQGLLHLKTDSDELYEFTLLTVEEAPFFELLYHNDDIYSEPLQHEALHIKTKYEAMHLENGRTIKYVQVRLKDMGR
ncbi:MAG: tRNA (guanosine(46)-N7)-methyltransferase TrmB [Saprospiraceae bacterium]|nr:tRNA (guanosine(46)-N7)-methyltransferase TrmB [Saprospiraceae bacterium]